MQNYTELYNTIQNYTKHAVGALVVCMTGKVVTMAADRRSACSHLGKASYSKTDEFSEKFETSPKILLFWKLDTDGVHAGT